MKSRPRRQIKLSSLQLNPPCLAFIYMLLSRGAASSLNAQGGGVGHGKGYVIYCILEGRDGQGHSCCCCSSISSAQVAAALKWHHGLVPACAALIILLLLPMRLARCK